MKREAQSTKVNSEILFLAKRFLSGQLGVIEAARELSPLRHNADSDVGEVLLTFTAIDSETSNLPVGRTRQQWRADALADKTSEIEKAEALYRNTAVDAATRLVHLLESPQ